MIFDEIFLTMTVCWPHDARRWNEVRLMHESSDSKLDFRGRVAVVTGAGGGLGRAYSHMLAQRGASVVVNDIGATVDGGVTSDDPATAVVKEILRAGGVALADRSDISDPHGAHALIDSAIATFGRVDIVVTNAGIVRRAPFGQVNAASFAAHLDVHLKGTFYVCRAAWSPMASQGHGRIVTIVSTALYGIEGVSAYASAKGGIAALTRSMSVEGAPLGIKANAVAPIAFTRMTASGPMGAVQGVKADPGLAPDRVAATVAVLAHENCPTTGETYVASGRRVARIFLGETAGLSSDDMTPELLFANWADVMDNSSYTIPEPRLEGATSLQAASGEGRSA